MYVRILVKIEEHIPILWFKKNCFLKIYFVVVALILYPNERIQFSGVKN